MRDRELLLLLLLLAQTADDGDEHSAGILSRLTSRATGVVVDAVEPDAVIEKVDVNALLDRVDVNHLLDRVDVNRLLDRVDVNALMDRVDVDALMDRVDVQELVDRAGISDIVAESTGAIAGSAIDVFRRQVVALDVIIGNSTYRLVGRDPKTRPVAPEGLDSGSGVDETGRGQISGHYAGPVSRLIAFGIDVVFMWLGYLLIALGISFLVDFFTDIDTSTTAWQLFALMVLSSWLFLYNWASYSIAGKTAGMAIVGLRVLGRNGRVLTGSHAAIRTLVLPISIIVFGLGLLGILFNPQRRSLHDAAAGSVVVYDWGDRPAEMPAPVTEWVNKRLDEDEASS
ncbi:MAG: RDD family protein [Acidimicrobiia bacterium]|nr:RDD family protein [Acidimicrobiia bacterium]